MHSSRDSSAIKTQPHPTRWPELSQLKTPCYVYDLALLDETIRQAKAAAEKNNIRVFYALKSNSNDRILRRISDAGIGADCVSGPEVSKALSCGFAGANIVLAGVGKTDEEIVLALKAGISSINVESLEELSVIADLSGREKLNGNISLRINPGVEAHTHTYITTGTEANKFGLSIQELPEALEILQQATHLNLTGIHAHIGSQITRPEVFRELCKAMNELNEWFIAQGILPKHINLGGGLSVNYQEPNQEPIADFEAYFSLLRQETKLHPGQELWCELGRSITAQCGSLLTRVLYSKKREKKNFLIVDAGMTELIRPALYDAHHHIENLSRNAVAPEETYDVVGPICESSDYLGKEVALPHSVRNDILAVRTAGAYGEAMSSEYNLRKKAAVYFIE
jgi:diaminopimelate decarboxylase